ncbi:MAG: hypothetical protein U9Q79_07025 [Candidatus Hydrogenedentes bacterium]|nr:hypothetical protein [Candidatus Hydrogenedentota bacterium]
MMSGRDGTERFLKSEEPGIRYKVQLVVKGKDPNSRGMKRLRTEIRKSPRVQALLSERDGDAGLRSQ